MFTTLRHGIDLKCLASIHGNNRGVRSRLVLWYFIESVHLNSSLSTARKIFGRHNFEIYIIVVSLGANKF